MRTFRYLWLKTPERILHKQIVPYRIKVGNEVILFTPCEIIRVEADGSYSKLVTNSGIHLLSRSIRFLGKELNGWGMIRINRSNIINVCNVKRLVDGQKAFVIMNDNFKIFLPQKRKCNLVKKLENMCY